MQSIDLSLAVNYIPACSCIVRLFGYLLLSSVLSVYEDNRTYVILAIILYVDRIIQDPHSFLDSNSIITTVFLVSVYQHTRTIKDDMFFAVLLVYFTWGLIACVFLLDIALLHRIVKYSPLCLNTIQVLMTCVVLVYLLFHSMHYEPPGCIIAKAVGFSLLATIWIYTIGLKNHVGKHQYIIVRFLPVLILPFWMAVILWISLLSIIMWHCRFMFSFVDVGMPAVVNVTSSTNTTSINTCTNKHDVTNIQDENLNDTDDAEAMFRLAKSSFGKL